MDWIHLAEDMEKLWDRVNTEIIDFHKMRKKLWTVEILASQRGLSSLEYDLYRLFSDTINTSKYMVSSDRIRK
jgi:hypothetical protein